MAPQIHETIPEIYKSMNFLLDDKTANGDSSHRRAVRVSVASPAHFIVQGCSVSSKIIFSKVAFPTYTYANSS